MKTIYEIHNGKVVSAQAKETKKIYTIVNCEDKRNFDYRTQIYKEYAFLSPEDAIKHHLSEKAGQISRIKKSLRESEQELVQLYNLVDKYGI